METGTVVYYNKEKGFGFIRTDNNPQDFYVHISNVENEKELNKGDRVTFEIAVSVKGMQAEKVEKVENSGKET